MDIKAITFDLDMTLIDFMKFKRRGSDAAANAMTKTGFKVDKDELFKFYMHDIEGDTVFGEFLKSKNNYSERILAAGINAYLKEKHKHLQTYPGVKKTLLKLKELGFKIVLITDAPRLKAFMRLDSLGIAELFDIVVGFEDTGTRKPSQLPFEKALKLLNLKPSQAMHVGDWPERDILGAKEVGMKTCLAEYGWNSHKLGKWIEPDYKIKTFEDIVSIVNV
ncbi:MAG: HAD-IA family hydrolase [archaeon]|jgi:putative hydrolase of the HAD superfamily